MKVLVTGAAGFIGSHVAHRLLARGDQVVGLDNLNDYYDPTLKQARLDRLMPQPGFSFRKLELADAAGMAALFASERFDRVVHLAAQAGVRYSLEQPQAYVDSNITGTLNVPGRMGSVDSEIYLCNAAVVAASAIEGRLAEPRKYL